MDAGRQTGISAGRVAILYGALPLALATVVVVSTMLVVIQWPVVDHRLALTWLAFCYLVTGLRWAAYLRYSENTDNEKTLPARAKAALGGIFLSALTWAAASLVLFPPNHIAHQVVLAFCLGGLAAGSVTTLSAQLPAAVGFLTLTLAPLVARFALAPHQFGWAMGILIALFLAILLVTSYRFNRSITKP